MSKAITFWQLIQGNKIEVPVIQRDYAQGREEDKVNAIRKDFVKDLISALEVEDKFLHLGFVYGKIDGKDKYAERERNKRAIENILNAVEGYAQQLDMRIQTDISVLSNEKNDNVNLPTFIPLDGQQRLTTLYLLHWYLVVFSEEDNIVALKTLDHFTYKTRKSSLEFCDAICQLENMQKLKETQGKLSEAIENNKWFRKSWLKDSTVKGMLVMLDAIHSELSKKENKSLLLQQLISEDSAIVTFDFLDLNELNQTDELYVKMNARGKQLTEFEHFKAWLQNFVSIQTVDSPAQTGEDVLLNDLIQEKDWKRKLDRAWLDMFWSNKEEGVYAVDNVIYNAFKQITLFDYIATSEKNENTLAFSRTVRDNSFIPFSEYQEHSFFNESTINFLFSALNALSNKEDIQKYESWLEDITCESFFGAKLDLSKFWLKNDKNPDRDATVFYYSFLLFLTSDGDKSSEIQFKNWMRFSRNIIFNTFIQNPENFFDAIQSLNKLKKNINTIKLFIANPQNNISFYGDAAKHESKKALLIEKNADNWIEAIIQFENHSYFKGDIGWLIDLAAEEDNKYSFQNFLTYGKYASELFSDKIRNHPTKLLERALLSCGDFLPEDGANHLIPLPGESLRARRYQWQLVFKDSTKRIFIKQLIDKIIGAENIESSLENLIDLFHQNDWRKYLVKSPVTINYCTSGQGYLRYNSENNILLMKTSRIYGTHAELRSYFHYVENIKNKVDVSPFSEVMYYSNKMGKYDFPVVRFKDWDFEGHKYSLEFTYKSDGKYLFQLRNQEPKIELKRAMLDKLSAISWIIQENKLIAQHEVVNEEDLMSELSTILNELKTL
jgi:hypothetical protein